MESQAHITPLTLAPDRRQSETALAIARGTARLLRSLGFSSLSELPLPSGRRADLVALNARNEIWIVEIKSSLEDLRAGLVTDLAIGNGFELVCESMGFNAAAYFKSSAQNDLALTLLVREILEQAQQRAIVQTLTGLVGSGGQAYKLRYSALLDQLHAVAAKFVVEPQVHSPFGVWRVASRA